MGQFSTGQNSGSKTLSNGDAHL